MTLRIATAGVIALLVAAGGTAAAPTAGPTSISVPVVSGTAQAGAQLRGGSGSWSGAGTLRYSFRWLRCDDAGHVCAPIAGAKAAAYVPVAADVGKTVALTVAASDASGTATVAAGMVGPIAAAASPLASTARPVVAGAAQLGSTLSVSAGTWTSTPTILAYAWLRCDGEGRSCVPIPDAGAATYTAAAADVGSSLVVRVQAKAGRTTQAVLSLPSAPIGAAGETPVGRPTLSGAAEVGTRLAGAAPPGARAGAAVTFQWYRCDATGAHCASVHGATRSTYTTVVRDAGGTIALTATVTSGGTSTAAYSSLLGPIAPRGAPGVSTAQPTVDGRPVQGRALVAAPGSWRPVPAAIHYAWQRCNANGRVCAAIDGATQSRYVPTRADIGHALASLVVATFGGTPETAFSVATAPVQAAVLTNTVPPTATGTLGVGSRLTASPGIWVGAPPITYRYQWYRCDSSGARCSSVHGATAGTYRLVAADEGHTLGLTVTATGTAGSRQGYASLVGPIAAAGATLLSTMQPQVSGAPIPGSTLSVDRGSWSTAPSEITYRWERCNANGRVCVPVPGAVTSSYAVTAADVGRALLAIVSARAGTAAATAFSTASRPVAAA